MSKDRLDDRDEKLLALLQTDARMPVSELARAVNLSPTAVRQRLDRLERDGVIQGYTLRLGESTKKEGMTVVVMLTLTGAKCKALLKEIGHLPEIRKFWSLAGEQDACLVLNVPDVERLQEMTEMLSDNSLVRRVQSHLVIETHRDN